jgi:hypothetical protein
MPNGPPIGPNLPFGPTMRLRTMRIIVFAMCLGILLFLGLALYLRSTGEYEQKEPTLTLSYFTAGLAVLCVVMSVVVPALMESAWRRTAPRELGPAPPPGELSAAEVRWWGLYQTRLIVRSALLEGPCFALLVAYLIEGQLWTVAVAVVVLLLLAAGFPTESGVRDWVERQRSRARYEE